MPFRLPFSQSANITGRESGQYNYFIGVLRRQHPFQDDEGAGEPLPCRPSQLALGLAGFGAWVATFQTGAHNSRQRAVAKAHGAAPVAFWADDRVPSASPPQGMLQGIRRHDIRDLLRRKANFFITSGDLGEAPLLQFLADVFPSPEAAPSGGGRRVGIVHSTVPGPIWAGAVNDDVVASVVHELGHVVMDAGAPGRDAARRRKTEAAHARACADGTYDKNAYILKDTNEYWACGTQAW